jgi:hypothetical protein
MPSLFVIWNLVNCILCSAWALLSGPCRSFVLEYNSVTASFRHLRSLLLNEQFANLATVFSHHQIICQTVYNCTKHIANLNTCPDKLYWKDLHLCWLRCVMVRERVVSEHGCSFLYSGCRRAIKMCLPMLDGDAFAAGPLVLCSCRLLVFSSSIPLSVRQTNWSFDFISATNSWELDLPIALRYLLYYQFLP